MAGKAEKTEVTGKRRVSKAKVEAKEKGSEGRMTEVEMAVLEELPSPEELAKYEKVIPGGAERILEMAENQARYQQEAEQQVLAASVRTERILQAITFVLALVAGGLGGALLLNGSELAGLIIILIDAAALVGITLYGKKE